MLTVFVGRGDTKVDGRRAFQWEGLPRTQEVLRRLGGATVEGMQLQVVGVVLSNDRINTYTGSDVSGSYDGNTLTVTTGYITMEPVAITETLEALYGALQELFFKIVHGLAVGDHKTAADN